MRRFSADEITVDPTNVNGRLVNPPMTELANTCKITVSPDSGETYVNKDHAKPPTAATPPEISQVTNMTFSFEMPDIWASSGLSAIALRAIPSFVFVKKKARRPRERAVSVTTNANFTLMSMPMRFTCRGISRFGVV